MQVLGRRDGRAGSPSCRQILYQRSCWRMAQIGVDCADHLQDPFGNVGRSRERHVPVAGLVRLHLLRIIHLLLDSLIGVVASYAPVQLGRRNSTVQAWRGQPLLPVIRFLLPDLTSNAPRSSEVRGAPADPAGCGCCRAARTRRPRGATPRRSGRSGRPPNHRSPRPSYWTAGSRSHRSPAPRPSAPRWSNRHHRK